MKNLIKNHRFWIAQLAPKIYLETAFSCGLLAFALGKLNENNDAISYAFFMFFAALTMYNLMRGVSLMRMLESRNLNVLLLPVHFATALISAVFCSFSFLLLDLSLSAILLIGHLSILTLFYRFKWVRIQNQQLSLSDLPYVKAILVAATWTLVCIVIPSATNTQNGWLIFGFFLYFLGLTVPFDIRDMYFDDIKRRTLAQIIGAKNAKRIAYLLILVAHCILFIEIKGAVFLLILSFLMPFALIARVDERKPQTIIFRLLDLAPALVAFHILTCLD